MSLDYGELERFKKIIEEFPETPEGKLYFENMKSQHELKLKRYLRFEEWLKNNDFEALMFRLIHEHNEDYREKCYHKGYEPFPNCKLAFLIDYITHNREDIRVPELDCDFSNQIWFFRGYYFQMVWGQGVITNIFNAEDKRHVLQV